ncbi:hypothetical protein FSARC_374 [Fusarium sarcochroum]|uniref:Xylanolytic transcriptional activator regulatory domain-containing protein n=1 Tax=Fusarium sarcochroum TaxID=1208366 RepID=A0A8H4UBZ7_9HYPO|nr:hypothetical protein FSARC_374 [Fusarium sarcochroum]
MAVPSNKFEEAADIYGCVVDAQWITAEWSGDTVAMVSKGYPPFSGAIAKEEAQTDLIGYRGLSLNRDPNDLGYTPTIHEELIGLLKNLPDQDAQDVLQRIRSGTNLGSVLNHVRTGDILLQMAVVPETRFRYEFPYRPEMLKENDLNNPYLNSIIHEAASLYSDDNSSEHTASHLLVNLGPEEHRSLYLKPFHAAQVIEPSLSDVKISLWTNVCDDDELMRDLLNVLFRCEYHFTAAFHKDLFLEDMAARRKDFCSSLLVNTLLAYACVCYPQLSNRFEYWNPNNLVYRFMAEAKRLWELEATVPRITTIQAGILFSVYHNLCGIDEIGQAYRIQAVALAHRLHIFDAAVEGQNERTHRGREYTAWALYNWETLSAFSFMLSPLVKKPPKWPLPDPSEDSSWYGEVWVKYPLNHGLSPSCFGQVLRSRSRFRIIMNEFCDAAYSERSEVGLDQAYQFYCTPWTTSTPFSLAPRAFGRNLLTVDDSMYYYHLLLTIFEPLLDVATDQEPSPQRVVADAKKHLQTLVRLYYLRHGFEAMDLFIVVPLMLTGYDCLDAIQEKMPETELETLRSTLILVAQGLYNQRRNHYLAQALFRVIRGRMRPQEVSLLKSSMALDKDEIDAESEMAVAVRSHWPVSVVKKQEDMDSHILTNLVESYGGMNIQEIL